MRADVLRAGVLVVVVSLLSAERTPSAVAGGQGNVEVIVNSSLYNSGQISVGLNQYLGDLQAQGFNPTLTTTSFASPAALRSHLANRYSQAGLAGAVLIGDLPIEHFERNGQFGDSADYQRFACDLYYMDVDGTWSDTTNNTWYDTHTGDVAPEIWVGRMTTSRLTSLHSGRTEAGLLDSYLQRNHAYRQGTLRLPEQGLAYIDDDWIPWASTWGSNLDASVSGTVDIVSNGSTTVASDYKNRVDPDLTSGYESLLLAAHSSAGSHSFKIGGDWAGGSVFSSELAALDPEVFFYNLFACSNANYEASGYMGGEYVFGTSLGLLAVGSTKTGGMLEFDDFYNPIGQGKTYGEAYFDWWTAIAQGGFSASEMDWHYGMTLLGDPLLLSQSFLGVPEGSTLAMATVGLLGLLIARWRKDTPSSKSRSRT